MYKTSKPFFIICESPLHAGSGSDLGIVDLPIQRERHTGFPKIESSSLKGSIRQAFENIDSKKKDINYRTDLHRVFGFDNAKEFDDNVLNEKNQKLEELIKSTFKDTKDKEFSSAIAFTDARLLLFPVKSMKGVFAWITCPEVLNRFKKDLDICKESIVNLPNDSSVASNNLIISSSNKIVLEEYTFEVTVNPETTKLAEYIADKIYGNSEKHSYWKEKLKKDLVILSDNDFKDFVNLSTEVITRTKINNETGTVDSKTGALFTEEYLPSDSIMYSIAMTSSIFCNNKGETFKNNNSENVMKFFTDNIPDVMQIGGNYTLGKGIVKISLEKGDK